MTLVYFKNLLCHGCNSPMLHFISIFTVAYKTLCEILAFNKHNNDNTFIKVPCSFKTHCVFCKTVKENLHRLVYIASK